MLQEDSCMQCGLKNKYGQEKDSNIQTMVERSRESWIGYNLTFSLFEYDLNN
jgi:hypothetical protein